MCFLEIDPQTFTFLLYNNDYINDCGPPLPWLKNHEKVMNVLAIASCFFIHTVSNSTVEKYLQNASLQSSGII